MVAKEGWLVVEAAVYLSAAQLRLRREKIARDPKDLLIKKSQGLKHKNSIAQFLSYTLFFFTTKAPTHSLPALESCSPS